MQLEIITPETKVFTGEATSVLLPGIDGLFQVLNNHAAIVSALKAGAIQVELPTAFHADEKTSKHITTDSNPNIIRINIRGGVAEMQQNKMIVLAE